jgi:hypothetical protein
MHKLLYAAAFAVAAISASAYANETEDFCVEFAGGNGWDTSPCSCVGEVAEGDSSVKEEILALSSAEDVDYLSDSTKEALSVCFPENG